MDAQYSGSLVMIVKVRSQAALLQGSSVQSGITTTGTYTTGTYTNTSRHTKIANMPPSPVSPRTTRPVACYPASWWARRPSLALHLWKYCHQSSQEAELRCARGLACVFRRFADNLRCMLVMSDMFRSRLSCRLSEPATITSGYVPL